MRISVDLFKPELDNCSENRLCDDIKLLQNSLSLLSLNFFSLPFIYPLEKDYNESVSFLVRAFQKANMLEETGFPDVTTTEKIHELCWLSMRIRKYIDEIRYLIVVSDEKYERSDYLPALNLIAVFNPHSEIKESKVFLQKQFDSFCRYYNCSGENAFTNLLQISERIISALPDRFFGNIRRDFPGKNILKGCAGTDIAMFQSCLRYKSYINKWNIHIGINGIYDDETEYAVKKIQHFCGLEENGTIGFFLWNMVVNQ